VAQKAEDLTAVEIQRDLLYLGYPGWVAGLPLVTLGGLLGYVDGRDLLMVFFSVIYKKNIQT
jgi:hypothetical protein